MKLENLPPIYYRNLQEMEERREYMEKQFKKYEIRKWRRWNGSIFGEENFPQWKKLVLDSQFKTQKRFYSVLLNRSEMIANFLFDLDSDVVLLLEDDLSFHTERYLNFEWEEFIERLPHNWDCVQLHIIGEKFMPLTLSPWSVNNHSAAAILINKRYADKYVNMFMENGKWRFLNNYGYSKDLPEYHYHSADFIPYQVGTTYSFPMFVTNSKFESDGSGVNALAKRSDATVLEWWKNNEKSLEEMMYLDRPMFAQL